MSIIFSKISNYFLETYQSKLALSSIIWLYNKKCDDIGSKR